MVEGKMKGLSEKRLSDYMAEQIADEILAEHPESRSVKHFRFWRVRG